MRPISLFRPLLWCYPAPFREEYGSEMERLFCEQWTDERSRRGAIGVVLLWLTAFTDTLITAPQEHLHMITQDIRYALRMLRKQPGFACVAVLSLALGIGANTAIFSLLNEALLRPLPAPHPEQLVMLTNPSASGVGIGSQTGRARSLLTYAEFESLRDGNHVFDGMFASESQMDRWQARISGGPLEDVNGRLVSGEFFSLLGAEPVIGRLFSREIDAAPGGAPYAVLSYDFWQRRFGGDPGVLGKKIDVRTGLFTVIGVARRGFYGETIGNKPDLWLPLTMQPQVIPGRDYLHEPPGSLEKVMWLHVFARLKPGVNLAQAQADMDVVFRRLIEAYYGSELAPETRKEFLDQKLQVREAARGASDLRERFAEPLFVLLAVVGVVLLIACGNLANLLLARAAARRREISVRLAIGAGRGRLVRQLLTESLLLAFIGGVAGIGVALLASKALVQLATTPRDPIQLTATVDGKVLAFTAALTILTALLFGVLPAWRVTGFDVGASLKEQGRGLTASVSKLHLGKILVVGQFALSLLLLVGAGLFLRTLHNLQTVDLGYNRDKLLIARIDLRSGGYTGNRVPQFYREMGDRLRSIPGVRALTYSANGLLQGTDSGDEVIVEGFTPRNDKDRNCRYDFIGPGYFSILGIPVVLGRDIEDKDREGGNRVAVINEAFAKNFFAGRNPIGLHLTSKYADHKTTYEIVGVAKNSRDHSLRADVPPRFFIPAVQPPGEFEDSISYELRTSGNPEAAMNAVRRVIQEYDPSLIVPSIHTMGEMIDARLAQERMVAQLSVFFGCLALVLAAIGLYGVLSYGVAQRTNEIGIRMALGARPGRVVSMVLGETGRMIAIGVVVGIAVAIACTRLVASKLFGLAPTDPATFAAAALLLSAVAIFAGYLPAARASKVDPLVALRHE